MSYIYMRQDVVPWLQDLEDKRVVLETSADGLREAIGQKPPRLWAALNSICCHCRLSWKGWLPDSMAAPG